MNMWEGFFTALFKMVCGWFVKIFKKKTPSLDEIKKMVKILFIDDESVEYVINNIREANWSVKQIKEVDNFDSEEIKNSDIIFVDFKNVGIKLTPTEEGIGILRALRNKYPEKHLIFYSGYAGFIPGHEVHDIADDWIPKNSDPYVYIDKIEKAAKKYNYGKK